MKGYGEIFRISGSAWIEREKGGVMQEGYLVFGTELGANQGCTKLKARS
jgi:hypothetical protein